MTPWAYRLFGRLILIIAVVFHTSALFAEDEDEDNEDTQAQKRISEPEKSPDEKSGSSKMKSRSTKRQESRKYMVPDPDRTDAGVFHIGFAGGGNFYIEPKVNASTKAVTGEYFKDFGFQAGVYFDYDYSALTENVPLGLRGMVGYKYILNSVHVFAFDALARRMFQLSEYSTFGIGLGGSAAVWYRASGTQAPNEEIIFLPSFLIGLGFEYNPFMIDFKWLINRFGQDSTITGLELYFGFRL